MAYSVIGIDKIAPELRDALASLGDRAVFLLTKKLTSEAKKNAPTLASYGQINRSKVPHKYKGAPGTLKNSIVTVRSIKKDYSYLVNARDWRARFIEFGTASHKMPATKSGRKRPYVFANPSNPGSELVFTKKIAHPGTQGFSFMRRATEDSVVDRYTREVIAEINNGS